MRPLPYGLGYTNWGAALLISYALAVVVTYGMRYSFTYPLYGAWLGSIILACVTRNMWNESLRTIGAIVLVLLSMACLGWMRTSHTIDAYYDISTFYKGVEGVYTMEVCTIPKKVQLEAGDYVSFQGTLQHIKPKKDTVYEPIKASGTIQVYAKTDQSIGKGDVVSLQGTVRTKPLIYDEGFFDLRARHITQQVVGTLFDGTQLEIVRSPSSGLYERLTKAYTKWMNRLHTEVENTIYTHLSPYTASLGRALLLGANYSSMDEAVVNSFAKTGLIHILSISGSHMTLLFTLTTLCMTKLGVSVRKATYGGIAVVCFYGALVGWDAPVIRSAWMGVISGVAILQGRLYRSLQALHVCGLAMLIYEPLQLMDVSFQFSLGATYGIILWGHSVYQLFPKQGRWIWLPISITLSAHLLVLPLQLYYFHILGYGTLLANMLVAPLLDLAIMALVVLSLLSVLVTVSWLWWCLDVLLKAAVFLNQSIMHLPYSYVWIPPMSGLTSGLYYLCVGAFHYVSKIRVIYHSKFCALCLGAALALGPMTHMMNTYMPSQYVLKPLHIPGMAAFLLVEAKGLASKAFLFIEGNGRKLSKWQIHYVEQSLHYIGLSQATSYVLRQLPKESIDSLAPYIGTLPSSTSTTKNGIIQIQFIDPQMTALSYEERGRHFFIGYKGRKRSFAVTNAKVADPWSTDVYRGFFHPHPSLFHLEEPRMAILWTHQYPRWDVDPMEPTMYVVGKEDIRSLQL